jgi:aspartate/methionine/tyrosine aminotransferase
MRRRLKVVSDWIAREELLEWVPPQGGVVCFPRLRNHSTEAVAKFYRQLMQVHGAHVGPGHWFEMPDRYFRLGYGWPASQDLALGLQAISAALRA